MTDSVDTDALREIAVREDRESDTFIDDDFADERYWELREVADALIAAADEIDALRARAERAEAVVAEVKRYADDRSVHAGTKNNTVGSWRIASDLHQIIARASQPASEPIDVDAILATIPDMPGHDEWGGANLEPPVPDYWCRDETCQYRNWRSGSMPTHKRGAGCPQPAWEVEQ